ncbi:EamA-like transporter family protein [Methylobacterium sp. WL64]|uniref:DMT family transporter n=1 Tax=Methylobacterium sp. WL64 TaxID=2603894 RepID=UPI0011CBFB1F|nr:DMT family transporter [Methylobacterium sp. WL64]TXM97798.1 EamA-like transporter family protein [Methylobacterium sp. WL64]
MWYLYGFVLLAGVANAVQAGQNGALSKGLDESLTAGLVVVAGTASCILVVGLLSGKLAWPTAAQALAMPWWAWLGGILGGGIILAQFLVARQIGAAPFLGLLVTAGVVTSILLDNYGWVGFERHPASIWRILGGFLMVAGVALVAFL